MEEKYHIGNREEVSLTDYVKIKENSVKEILNYLTENKFSISYARRILFEADQALKNSVSK